MPAAIPIGAAVAGAAAGSLLNRNGGQGGTTQTVTNNSPWAGAAPYLLDINQRAQNNSYGQAVAPQSLFTGQSQQLQAQRALAGNPLNQAAQQQNLATLRGDYTDLSKNPAAQNAMDLAKSNVNAQFTGDNWGNSAHQEWLNRGLMNAAAPFYESERQRQVGATALAPTLANQDYTDIGQLGAVGGAQDAYAQQQLDSPWTQLQRYQGLVSGSGGTSTMQQPYFTNNAAAALGGGMAGLGLYNSINQAGLFGNQQNPDSYSSTGQFMPAYTGYGAGGYQYG